METLVDRVAAVAEKQEAVVSEAQLKGAGLGQYELRCWVTGQRLLRTEARNVFRMPGAEPTWKQALWIAVLAGPKGTVVSHLSAAALRGLLPPTTLPHVTVPRQSSGRLRVAVAHHATVSSADRCWFQRLPTTGVARTIVDCAPLLDQAALDSLLDAALGRGLGRYRQIRAAHERAGRVRGADRLKAALAPYAGDLQPRSEKEAHVLRLLHSWGLPSPETQYVIRDERARFVAKVDCAWVAWRFGLEYDGDEFHPPRRWTLDDRRQARIERLGWRLERTDRFDLRPSSTRLRTLLTSVLGQPLPTFAPSPLAGPGPAARAA